MKLITTDSQDFKKADFSVGARHGVCCLVIDSRKETRVVRGQNPRGGACTSCCYSMHSLDSFLSQLIRCLKTHPANISLTRFHVKTQNIPSSALLAIISICDKLLSWQQLSPSLQDDVLVYIQQPTCKFGYKVTPLASVANLATRWCHFRWFQIWSAGGATYIATLLPGIWPSGPGGTTLPNSLGFPCWRHQLVTSWYLRQPESHQLSLTKVSD